MPPNDKQNNEDIQNRLSKSEAIDEYMHFRRVMEMFTKGHQSAKIESSSPDEHTRMLEKMGYDTDNINSMSVTNRKATDELGKETNLRIYEIKEKDKTSWIVQEDLGLGSFGDKVHIEKKGSNYVTDTSQGISISSKVSFRGQQTHGVMVHGEKEKRHQKAQLLVYATGTGKSFVIVAPAIANGEGIFVVPDATMARQLSNDIKLLDENLKEGDIAFGFATSKGKENEAIKTKHTILTYDDLERFIPHIEDKTVYMDEAHLSKTEQTNKLLDNNNTVLAVTATPTKELIDVFDEPIAEINMHYALNDLKAFRHITLEERTHKDDASLDDQVLNILADYYGTIGFLEETNQPIKENTKNKLLTLEEAKENPELRNMGSNKMLQAVIENNEIKRSDKMNMVFSKDEKLNNAIADAYQAVFDNTYKHIDKLTERVTEMRAQSRAKEMWRLDNKLLADSDSPNNKTSNIPDKIDLSDPAMKERFAPIIKSSKVTGETLQQESQDALKQQIANVINRKTVGILRDDTPEKDIRKFEVGGQLPDLLKRYEPDGLNGDISPRADDIAKRMTSREANSPYEKIAAALENIDRKDDILKAIENKEYSKMLLTTKDIDLSKMKDVKYVEVLPEHDEKRADEMAGKFAAGKIMHLVNDSKLVAGFSNPDIMSVQRVVKNLLEEAVIRATQMLGRVIREKDGLAFASEHISETLAKGRELGKDKIFGFKEVLSKEFMPLAQKYLDNFAKTFGVAKKDPIDTMEDAVATKQTSTKDAHKDKKNGR